jgi:hypothetical protein
MTLKATAVDLDWADGKYTFDLGPIGALRIHDEALKIGPGHVLRALMVGDWRFGYVRETIRCALIGGGMAPVEAMKKVELYVDGQPYRPNILVAIEILSRFLDGAPEDAVQANPPIAPETGPDGSTSSRSTETASS